MAGELTLGAPPEFQTRADGIPGLREVYGVKFKAFKKLDPGGPLTQNALKNGQIDAGDIFTTDPLIAKNGWVVLEDPKSLFRAQRILPLIRTDALTDEIRAALDTVSQKLNTEDLTDLLARVYANEPPEQVAMDWLTLNTLIWAAPATLSARTGAPPGVHGRRVIACSTRPGSRRARRTGIQLTMWWQVVL